MRLARRSAILGFAAVAAACALPLRAAEVYVEDFDDEPDGPPQDWYVSQQTAAIDMGWLSIYPTGQEPFVFAGRKGVPIHFERIRRIKFTVEFLGRPLDAVGRHGGVVFCCTEPTQRYGAGFRGYMIDWIDRVEDHGYRIVKMKDGGQHTFLSPSVGSDHADPGTEWEIAIDDGSFTLTVDGETFGPFVDAELRSGYVGFWCYTNAGQNLIFDNVEIESSPCSTIAPASVSAEPGETVSLTVRIPPAKNATADYETTVRTSDPAIAVPLGAAGDSLTLTFPAGGTLAQSFEVQCKAAGKATICLAAPPACEPPCAAVEVTSEYVIYEEDFAGEPDGPSEDWYVATPEANILDEEFELAAMGAEPTAYIGIGGRPLEFEDLKRIQFRIRFGTAVEPGIGAHGGIIIAASNPGLTRYFSTNYVFDWLARDFTYRFYKTINGSPTTSGTQVFWPSVIPPSRTVSEYWRIELAGTTIRAWATDEELDFYKPVDPASHPPVFEVDDATHRSGTVGFWGYSNANQRVTIDDVRVKFRATKCPGLALSRDIVWLGDPDPGAASALATITVPFGTNATSDYTVTLTSSDPRVAVPAGAPGGSLALTFPRGGSLIQEVEIDPLAPGETKLRLAAPGVECPGAAMDLQVKTLASAFCDRFAQADGAPRNWTIFAGDGRVGGAGTATVDSGQLLVTRYVGGETWVWADGEDGTPLRFGSVETIRLNVDLTTRTPDAVGRHGGILFFAGAPTQRWATSGYELDWIDRAVDHGYRFIRSDNGTHTLIAGPTFDLFPEPAQEWAIEIDDEAIRFYADGDLVFEVFDSTYRSGFFGLWTYAGGTEMRIDDVAVGMAIEDCGGVPSVKFIRGSSDGNASLTIGDAIFALNYLFASGATPPCVKAADFDDSGSLTIGDPIGLLNFLFANGPPPAPPSPGCGPDPTPDDPLPCESFPGCPQ